MGKVEELAVKIQRLSIEEQFKLAGLAAQTEQWDLAESVGQVALDRVTAKRLGLKWPATR